MKRYKHNFEDGQIVYDSEFDEVFEFSDKRDGLRAEMNPNKLRLATDDEKKQLQ